MSKSSRRARIGLTAVAGASACLTFDDARIRPVRLGLAWSHQ